MKLPTKYVGTTAFALMLTLSACGGGEDSSDGSVDSSDGSGEGSGYENITITFSHNQPEDSPEHAGAVAFQEHIEEETDGNVTVDLYPDSQMGSLREQVESTQLGEIDITMQPSAVVSPFVDAVKIVDLPYLWPESNEQKYEVQDSEVGEELLGTLNQGQLEGLGYWPGGFKLFTTSGKEIHKPSDFEGLTMRTMESPALISQYEGWGGNAEPVPYAEVYNALQQGVVDGQENPLQTIYLNDYHKVQDYVIESHHGTMTYLLMANQSWFNGLNEQTQEAITAAEEVGVEAARDSLAETEDEYRQKIKDSEAEYYELTDEEIQTFREASQPIHEEIVQDADQQEILEKMYNKIEEVSGQSGESEE
ncbi:TRAP transporter substrate-binding protein [Salibacterium salarium]|uniref:TRAP transporter substrate-binding protein n=1 Tax=Salibacterium salarium TaxID=284579 RepID=UPI001FEAF3F7|nr:TRAP transporter substrate-binding protein [Salibacterium salarium]